MIQSLKDNAKTITLWVGIALALLLLLGTFGLADASVPDLGFDGLSINKDGLLSKLDLEQLKDWSAHLIKVIFAV